MVEERREGGIEESTDAGIRVDDDPVAADLPVLPHRRPRPDPFPSLSKARGIGIEKEDASTAKWMSGTQPRPFFLQTVLFPTRLASPDFYRQRRRCKHGRLGVKGVSGAPSSFLLLLGLGKREKEDEVLAVECPSDQRGRVS